MNLTQTRSLLTRLLIIAALFGLGCSEERVPTSLPDTHPASWIESTSPDFHGRVVMNTGLEGCQTCHGVDLSGGAVGVSCVDCHLSSGACTSCHGGLDNTTGAPPYGLRGETAPSTLAVGAHTVHLAGSSSAAVVCSNCHIVPVSMLEIGHLDRDNQPGTPLDSIAEITWQGLAARGNPTWDRPTGSCQDTYCHGSFTGGYVNNAPIWNGTDQALCGSCHNTGDTPADLLWKHDLHVGNFSLGCIECHSEVVDSALTIITPALHVNGITDVQIRDQGVCDRCHTANQTVCVDCHGGTDNQTGAPPTGLRGEIQAQDRPVGAHTTHVEGSYVADAFDCEECHIVPTTVADNGHWGIDSVAEISWGPTAGGASSWTPLTRVCADTYCHGNFSGGDPTNGPIWTAPGQATCGSCHDDGTDPDLLTGKHKKHVQDKGVECNNCHASVIDASRNIIGKSLHVDGVKTINFAAGGTFQNGRCSGIDCHGDKNW